MYCAFFAPFVKWFCKIESPSALNSKIAFIKAIRWIGIMVTMKSMFCFPHKTTQSIMASNLLQFKSYRSFLCFSNYVSIVGCKPEWASLKLSIAMMDFKWKDEVEWAFTLSLKLVQLRNNFCTKFCTELSEEPNKQHGRQTHPSSAIKYPNQAKDCKYQCWNARFFPYSTFVENL